MPKIEQLLATKLYIPSVRPELVPRQRLIEQLNNGLHRKLTLISAPAGFGKTTLIGEWLGEIQKVNGKTDRTEFGVAWLSLDKSDNEETRFLKYFVTALKQIKENENAIGKGADKMLQSTQSPPAELVLTTLINDLAALTEKVIFVLDDYHLIDCQPIHDALGFFIENMPSQIHLVITTREDPLLPIPRLRARDQLTELRAADLRFTLPEVSDFLNRVMGLNLSTKDITALETRTEGWIAGLQLAAISLQGRSDTSQLIETFSGSHRLVLDYLIEEVLSQQPETTQTFLLKTSILNRLTGPLCDAITGQNGSQALLETLGHANMFIISLDNEREWYRYHHLFADLLRKRLDHIHPELSPVLHRGASKWYEQNGFDDEAIEHALLGGDFDHAAEIIERHIDDTWGAGQHAVIQRWMADLPDELVFSKPHLCIFHAWYLFVNGQRKAARQALQAAARAIGSDDIAEAELSDRGLGHGLDKIRLQGRVAAVYAFMASYSGDLEDVIQHARQAYDKLPAQDLTWRCLTGFVLGDALLYKGEMAEAHLVRLDTVNVSKKTGHYYLILIAHLRLAETLRYQGKLKQVADLCRQQMQFMDENGISHTVAAGWLLTLWGDVLSEMNEIEEAITQAQKGVDVAGRGRRDVSFFAWSNLYLLRVLFSNGDVSGAEEVIRKMQNVARERDLPILAQKQLSAWQARIWMEQNDMDAATRWVEKEKLNPDGEISFFNESQYIVFARILSAQGKTEDAIRIHQRLLENAEAGGRTLRVIEILMLQAITYRTIGDGDQAMNTLEKALKLAEPEGFIRIFVDEGIPMARLLYEALSRKIASDYVQRLLSAFPDEEDGRSISPQPASSEMDLIEPLSERELEILQLIAGGLSNQEIGSQLYLSLNTVKAHTRNIYGKLGVKSRTQAAARARTLGILPTAK